MLPLIYKLWTLTQSKQLGGWLPLPLWVLRFISAYPLQKQIHVYATLLKGTDLSYKVKNDVACAESVSRILYELRIIHYIITGTWTLYDLLEKSPRFVRVTTPQAGDIVVSPSGMGNGTMLGHTGIVDKNNRILSNDSGSGKFLSNYTILTWNARYKVKGGFPVYYYRIIK